MKIGMMSFAHMHAYSYVQALEKLENVTITAIFDDEEKRQADLQDRYGVSVDTTYEAFFEKVFDAVIICSENTRHREMVEQAAKHKKHILCEKPLATTIEDCLAMIECCREHDVILQTAFPVRYCKPIQELKKKIDDGELGEIIAFRTTNRGQNPGGWFIEKEKSGGGAVLDHTVHMVDIMRWLINSEVKTVDAYISTMYNDIEIDDAGILQLEFENGVIASHDASWSRFPNYPTWGDVTIEAIGTKKTVIVDAMLEHIHTYFKYGETPSEFDFVGQDMDEGLITDFIHIIQEHKKPSITGEDGLRAVEVALLAYQVAK